MNVEAAARADRGAPPRWQPSTGRTCVWQDLGRLGYREAWDLQLAAAERLKNGDGEDRLLFVEHPPVVTLGRNARSQNLLLSAERLAALGVALEETDRGGDVTYHAPGQLVGYPIFDLAQWKKDVLAYMRALEEVVIRVLADFGVAGGREQGATGVWVDGAKACAMGVHISRWVATHGFALNVTTDLSGFGYIVPCGLTKPVTSLERLLGQAPPRETVRDAVVRRFGEVFGRAMAPA